ncbi:MAG TPA: DMT family transporter, partial [Candidatus Binatia bacterium]|nr:DMT family transporter [Candidatus Binatia bacterium]
FFHGAEPSTATAPSPALGNLVAAGTGLTWALTVVGLRWLGRGDAHATRTTLIAGNALAFVGCLPLALPLPSVPIGEWLLVAYLGTFQIGLAYALLARGLPYVPALEATLLLLLEPVLNPIWAWLVHGEVPNAWSLAGGSVILLATLVKTVADARRVSHAAEAVGGPRSEAEMGSSF